MDNKEIISLENQAMAIISSIEELQHQIEKYKSGAEAFSKASNALEDLAVEQRRFIDELKNGVTKIHEIDAVKYVSDFNTTAKALVEENTEIADYLFNNIKSEFGNVQKNISETAENIISAVAGDDVTLVAQQVHELVQLHSNQYTILGTKIDNIEKTIVGNQEELIKLLLRIENRLITGVKTKMFGKVQ